MPRACRSRKVTPQVVPSRAAAGARLSTRKDRPSTTVRHGWRPWKISSASASTGKGTRRAAFCTLAWAPNVVSVWLM